MNNENNVSLSDLANGAIPTATPVGMPTKPKLNTSNVREANLSEAVLPVEQKPIEGTGNPMLDKAFEGIDSTISRLQSETNALYAKGQEERIEKAIDEDDADIDSIDETLTSNSSNTVVVHSFENDEQVESIVPEPTPVTVPEKKQPVTVEKTVEVSAPVSGTKKENIIIAADTSVYDDDPDDHLFDGIEDEDMKYLDEDEEETSNSEISKEEDEKAKTEEIKENIRHEVNKNFAPIANKLNLSNFTISKKPINAAKVINDIKTNPKNELYDVYRLVVLLDVVPK